MLEKENGMKVCPDSVGQPEGLVEGVRAHGRALEGARRRSEASERAVL